MSDLAGALQSLPTAIQNTEAPATTEATGTPIQHSSQTPPPSQTTLPSPTSRPTIFLSPTPTATWTALPTPTFTSTIEPSLTPEQKPISTLVPRPTPTSSPTPAKAFVLSKKLTFCEPTQPGQLQVNLTNSTIKPAAGVELVITWSGGEEHFFTGLKPELGYGYTDFTMTAKIEYALSLSAGETRVTGLSAPPCVDLQGNAYPGGIRLEFSQP
jgi:hypothetical protein